MISENIYTLTRENITCISQFATSFLKEINADRKNIAQIQLMIEEILQKWQAFFGEEKKLTIKCAKRFGKTYIKLQIYGTEFNPIPDAGEGEIYSGFLAGIGIAPIFTYSKGSNAIMIYPPKKKLSMTLKILISVILATIAGIAGNLISPQLRHILSDNVLSPIYDTFLGLIAMLAGPLIFCTVFTGICGSDDIKSMKKISKNLLYYNILWTALATIFSILAAAPLLNVSICTGPGGEGSFSKILDMLLDIIPDNLVNPFVTGNSIQIVVIAICFGTASLLIGDKTDYIVCVVDSIKNILSVIMEWVTNLMPGVIFIVIVKNIFGGTISTIIQCWKIIAITMVCGIIIFALQTAFTSLETHAKFLYLLKKSLPAALIGMSVCSSSAVFSDMLSACEKDFKIKSSAASVTVPLCMMLVKYGAAIEFAVCIIYALAQHNIAMSISMVFSMLLSVTLVSVALPPVAGASIACFSMLFTQFGIPAEAVAAAIAADIVLDFLITPLHVASIQITAARSAHKLGNTEKFVA